EERPPVKIERGAIVEDSMITDGSIICSGARVVRSVLSPGVYVGPGAYIYESVILTDSYIERDAVVERAVIDKGVVVGEGAHVGELGEVGDFGIACIGKNTTIPPGFRLHHSAVLGADMLAEDILEQYPNGVVPAGVSVGVRTRKWRLREWVTQAGRSCAPLLMRRVSSACQPAGRSPRRRCARGSTR